MSTPESMDVTKSEVNEGLPRESAAVSSGESDDQAPAAMMDTGDNVDPSCTSTTQATAESSATKMDESGPANDKGGQGGDEADSKDMSGADEGATGGESQTGAGAGAGGDERETSGVKIKPDGLPKIDIVMCFGRCQDCTLKAGVKIRYENTKSDLLLCRECQDIHLEMKVPGETKLDINEEINQHDSKDYPPEKRVPWESKNRPNYAPAQKHKYIKEKYLRRVAFENLDVPVEDLQKKFEYQQVISDGLQGGAGTIEFLIPDFQKPWAGETGVGGADDTSVDGTGVGKTDATGDNSGAADGSGDITDTKEGDGPTGEVEEKESKSPADGGDAAMSGSDTEVESKIVEAVESGDHSKTSEMTEGGESEMTEGVASEMTDGVESEMTEGGESEMTEGVESEMTEGVESEMTEGVESEMTDANVEAGDQSGNTRSTEEVPEVGVEKPIGSVTIEGAELEKVTYDADNIRFFGLAYNGDDSFFVQMSIELGEWNIKNYFFTLKDDTNLFQLVNNARRMMFIMRGGDHYAADFLNYMEPINRLCQVKVTKKKKTEAGYEDLWKEKKFLASLDPEYLWLKKTALHEKDEALLLAFYDHEDKEKNIINEVKLRYSHKRAWITTHIFTTNDFEYMIEACSKNDKNYHLLKSKMTRSPLPQGVLKDPPRFVDIVKYLMDIMHPVTFGVVKEKEARQKRMWLRDNPGKTQDGWDEFKMNDVEGMQKRPDIQNPPTVTQEQLLASYAAKSAKSKAGLQQAKNPEQRAQDEALKLLDLNMIVKPIDSSYQEMPSPKDDDLKKKWGEFCDVYKAHQTFSTDAFDATGLDDYNEDGFDGCVSEIETNFKIGDYTAVIHQAASLLEYYKMTLNSRIRDAIAERHLLKFIYRLIIPTNVLSSMWTLDTKDVPGLAPQDDGIRFKWERFREVYNRRSVFPEDMLSKTGVFDGQESFDNCVTEIQTAFCLDDFEKVIDLSRAVLKEFKNTYNESVRQKVKENSLLKFIFKTVFGDDALPDPESLAAAAAFVDTSDVPGLAPEDEGMKEQWNTFKQVFLAREDFPPDAVTETEVKPNSREEFDTLVCERLQTGFFTMEYDNVIDVARSMMDIFKKSSIAQLKAAASERYLLKFIYKMIFHWPPTD